MNEFIAQLKPVQAEAKAKLLPILQEANRNIKRDPIPEQKEPQPVPVVRTWQQWGASWGPWFAGLLSQRKRA